MNWSEQFLNPMKPEDYIPMVFCDIFNLLVSKEKRGIVPETDVPGRRVYKPVAQDGEISDAFLKAQIGDPYKKIHDFMVVSETLHNQLRTIRKATNRSMKLKEISEKPECLGSNWGVLTEDVERDIEDIMGWLQGVPTKERNPITIKTLQEKFEIFHRAYEAFKPGQPMMSVSTPSN